MPSPAEKMTRNLEIWRARLAGDPYRAIGEHFGISTAHAAQIVRKIGRSVLRRCLSASFDTPPTIARLAMEGVWIESVFNHYSHQVETRLSLDGVVWRNLATLN